MYFLVDFCGVEGIYTLFTLLHYVVDFIKFGIPLILIVLGMLDLGKAVMAGKEEDQKKAQSLLLKRVIYAVAIYFVVTIVFFVFNLLSDSGEEGSGALDWHDCWDITG